ncbi:MAG TPA: IclR family transcriptional regulator [Burkholderiaceae bacterium]|nr:IclR family transcriptional regulator [Burkholderiaceae bacterium]
MTSPKPADNVRAVERALAILKAFTAHDAELTAGQLLTRVDLSRPTLYRLLQTLQTSGFVVASGNPQRFRLGPAVAHLVHVWTSNQDIAEHAQPMLARLWEQTGETVALYLLDGDDRVCVAELPSAQPLSFRRGIGYRAPITMGASGRAIRAWLTDRAAPAAAPAAAELQRIRANGYAVSFEELIQGAVAVAAPVFDAASKVLGAVAVFGPGVRLPQERIETIGRLVSAEAAAISAALGALPQYPATACSLRDHSSPASASSCASALGVRGRHA